MKLTEKPTIIRVKTSRFGEIAVDPDKVISMSSALPGFPEARRFVLRQHDHKSPFMWLQSLDNPDLAFIVIQAGQLVADYQPQLPLAGIRELGASVGSELEILLILAIPHGKPQEMTANLLGPMVINWATRMAKQVLLDPQKYDARWPVFTPALVQGE
ncbi:MAG: hypothetical protein EYX74_07410 [Desulfobulbaceae bacterium]|nr:MAG: hypothetical protein EYX74_07410 [Desulfobulbaceae bacterium]